MVMTVTAAEEAASGEVESEAAGEDGSWKTVSNGYEECSSAETMD